jgi:quercetin dioxygenase-like cupin family protein
MRHKLAAFSLALALLCLSSAGLAEPEAHKMLPPDEVKWADVPSLPPGAKLAVLEGPLDKKTPIAFRIKLPANYKIPAHWHPTTEHVTVLSGSLNLGTGDKFDQNKTSPLPAGGFAIMPAKMHHFAWTKEETILQVHATGPWQVNYVNASDSPKTKQ